VALVSQIYATTTAAVSATVLLYDSLALLLQHVTASLDSSSWPPVLDANLIKQLLLIAGEVERSQDKQLVQEMLQVATITSEQLDLQALRQAVTNDVLHIGL